MKNLPELKGIPTGELEKAGVLASWHPSEPFRMSVEESLESLADELFSISLSTGPGASTSPETAPEEIESVYHWFLA